MREDYVSYELAKKLKTLGFDEECWYHYDEQFAPDGHAWPLTGLIPKPKSNSLLEDDECSAPTLWQAWKWLRYEKNIDVEVNSNTENYEIVSYEWSLFWMSPCDLIDDADDSYTSYEEALEAGIMRAVEMLLSGELDEEDDE